MHETVLKAVEEHKKLANLLAPKCEYESKNLKASFIEAQDQAINRMTDMRSDAWLFIDDIYTSTQRYVTRNMSLNDYALHFDLIDQQNRFNAYTLALENLIGQKIVTIKRLVSHGNSLEELSGSLKPEHNETDEKEEMKTGSGFGRDAILSSEDVIERLRNHVRRLVKSIAHEEKHLRNYADGNVLNEQFFKKNYLQLDLFYKTLTDKKVTQQKAYEYPALLSELGGLMGLLLGGSVITIFEMLDLFIYNGFVKCCDKKKKSKNNSYSPTKVVESNHNNYLSATKAAYDLRKKRMVPLASMDTMEGLEISMGQHSTSPLTAASNYNSRFTYGHEPLNT